MVGHVDGAPHEAEGDQERDEPCHDRQEVVGPEARVVRPHGQPDEETDGQFHHEDDEFHQREPALLVLRFVLGLLVQRASLASTTDRFAPHPPAQPGDQDQPEATSEARAEQVEG